VQMSERGGGSTARLVVEVAVQAQNVGVSQVRLDLDLAAQLLFGIAERTRKQLHARKTSLRALGHVQEPTRS